MSLEGKNGIYFDKLPLYFASSTGQAHCPWESWRGESRVPEKDSKDPLKTMYSDGKQDEIHRNRYSHSFRMETLGSTHSFVQLVFVACLLHVR